MKKIIIFLLMLCMMMNSGMVFAAEESIWADWTYEGTVTESRDSLLIESAASTTSIATCKPGVSDVFDLSFSLQITNFGTNGEGVSIQVATGKHRLYLVIAEKKMKYMSKTYSTTGFSEIPFTMDKEMHDYRIVGKEGGICQLLIDGKFAAEMDVQTNTDTRTRFAVQKDADIVLKYFAVNKVVGSSGSGETDVQKRSAEAFISEFEEDADINAWSISGPVTAHDGLLEINATNVLQGSPAISRKIGSCLNYTFEIKMKIVDAGGVNSISVDVVTGEYYVTMGIKETGLQARSKVAVANAGYHPAVNDGQWHTYQIKTYDEGTRAIISIDGEAIWDYEVPESYYGASGKEIYIGMPALLERPYQVFVDSVKFQPEKEDAIAIDVPKEDAEYLQGEAVQLRAKINNGFDIPYVEYRIHNSVVATGYAPDYAAELKNLKPSNYLITAKYGEHESAERYFKVLPSVKADINLDFQWKIGAKASVKLDFYDEFNQIDSVNYYLDGIKVAQSDEYPFAITMEDVAIETHRVFAECVDKNGLVVYSVEKEVVPEIAKDITSVNFSNQISYSVDGEDGEAEVTYHNGNHQLYLKHSAKELSYLTNTGMKTYPSSVGEYIVITDAYVADVYCNGQFIFSYIMPMTNEIGKSVVENGLTVEDFQISIPERKGNYFVKRDFKVADNGIYAIPDVTYDYNLDFVLRKGEDVEIGVADGHYNLSVEINDGKIYAYDSNYTGKPTEKRHLADVPEGNEVYFRIENYNGMARLYANGSWLTTIGNGRSTAKKAISVETNSLKGLKYIAVSNNSDLFLYQESFDGTGELEALDYLVMENLDQYVDKKNGHIMLKTADGEVGRMMTHTSTGNAEVSADVEIKECEGGIWFIYNKCSDWTYSKAGYNFVTGEFEIINTTIDGEVKKTSPGELKQGDRVKLSLKVEKNHDIKTAVLCVDGTPVISDEKSLVPYGAAGMEIQGGVVYLHDFEYAGDAKPMADMKVFDMVGQSHTYNLVEWEDEWVLMNDSRRLHSTDQGAIWTAEYTTKYVDGVNVFNGDSNSTLTLPSGEMLSISKTYINQGEENNPDPYDRNAKNFRVSSSTDGGRTWSVLGYIFPEAQNRDVTCNRLRQASDGRLYYGVLENLSEEEGSLIVCYSDDNGRNWTIGPEVKYSDVGISCQEAEILPMPDGEVRIYMRNETGTIQYIVSKDRGETWDYTTHKTPLLSVLSHFNIEKDPYEENTYWAVQQYSNRNDDGRPQRPRTRVVLSRSTDGCETWEFLGTLYEFDVDNFIKLRGSDNHMMNINVNATKDYVIATLPIKREDQSGYVNRIVTLRKDKLKPAMKSEKLHSMASRIDTNEILMEKKYIRTIVLAPDGKTALVNGNLVANAAENGSLYLEVVASYLGWNLDSVTNDLAVLTCGDTSVSCDITSMDGNHLISLEELANKFCLNIIEKDGYILVSPYDTWTEEQWNSFKAALNPLYRNTGKLVDVGSKTTVSEDKKSFSVDVRDEGSGNTVILALYDEGVLVDVQMETCRGEEVGFVTDKAYTDAKVMVWENVGGLFPLSQSEIVV